MEYSYPFSTDWSTNEIVDVIKFFEGIEKAYENGIERDKFMAIYRKFKEVVPSIAEEKRIFREFEDESGYSSYHVVKKAKDSKSGDILKF